MGRTADWFHIQLLAVDHLAWLVNKYPAVRDDFHRSCEACYNLAIGNLRFELDRLDWLVELVVDYPFIKRKFVRHRIPSSWIDVLPRLWMNSTDNLCRELMPIILELAQDPLKALGQLDSLHILSSPAAALFFAKLREVDTKIGAGRVPPDWDDMHKTTTRFFLLLQSLWYEQSRWPVLEFCIRHGLEPSMVASVGDEVLGTV